MDALDVRGEPEAIDAPWMTLALERAGVAGGATVDRVEIEGAVGTGQTGRNIRLRLDWSEPAGRPETVVAKFASADAGARAAAFANGTYETEWAFYERLASTLSVRTPTCHAALWDAAGPDFVLVLEDLVGSRQGDQLEGLCADEAALALEQAVGFHAPRWADPRLPEFAPHKPPPEFVAMALPPVYDWAKGLFLERLGERLDPDVAELVERLSPVVGRWAAGNGEPPTLAHLDFRADNLMFGEDPGAPPIVVLDWQTASVGSALWDVAYLVGGAFDPAERSKLERDLLGEYVARMGAAGVSLEPDAAWTAYRLGAIWGVVMSVVATPVAEETERGNAMLTSMAQRHGRHVLDLESLALLSA